MDGGGTLAWFKKKIDAVTDPDQLPGTAARLIEVLARNGMDTATRNTLRGYVKTRKLIPAAEFDRITLRRKPISRTVTPLPDMHSCTPPGGLALTRTFCAARWCARGCAWGWSARTAPPSWSTSP